MYANHGQNSLLFVIIGVKLNTFCFLIPTIGATINSLGFVQKHADIVLNIQ